MMVGIITGMGIGHKIGSDYLGKWQSFDLSAFKQDAGVGMTPNKNNYAGLTLKIPFR